MRWKVFSGALNAKLLIGFLQRLTRPQQRKIFLILDNLRVHHSKLVKRWREENADKIEVFYLPSYSPELNPDELLNADLKQRVTTAPARTGKALKRTPYALCGAFKNNRNASRITSSIRMSAMPLRSIPSGPGQ
jgi:transposase